MMFLGPIAFQSIVALCKYMYSILAINCGDPPSIPNGQATFSSTNFTSVATYVCQKGYTLEKNGSTVICQANGQWKGPPPTCVGK